MSKTRHELLEKLRILGERFPDMRFGQLVLAVSQIMPDGREPNLYDIEDADMLASAICMIEFNKNDDSPI